MPWIIILLSGDMLPMQMYWLYQNVNCSNPLKISVLDTLCVECMQTFEDLQTWLKTRKALRAIGSLVALNLQKITISSWWTQFYRNISWQLELVTLIKALCSIINSWQKALIEGMFFVCMCIHLMRGEVMCHAKGGDNGYLVYHHTPCGVLRML